MSYGDLMTRIRMPIGSLADIPIERESVGAMGLGAGGHKPSHFVSYVYRGTGEDQFPETLIDPDAPAPAPPPPPRKPTKAQIEKRQRDNEVARQRRADRLAARQRYHAEWEARQLEQRLQSIAARGAMLDQGKSERQAERETRRLSNRTPRPAPGWKPLIGSDILELLDDT